MSKAKKTSKAARLRADKKRNTLHVEDVPPDLRRAFHAACVRKGTSMRACIKQFMGDFIRA